MTGVLHLADGETARDLATFTARAARVDPGGAVRLVGHGVVLAVYVCPVHGGGGPTVMGLRTLGLRRPVDLDVTVALDALRDRFARTADSPEIAVPPAPIAGVAWAGTSPPRTGWQDLPAVDAARLRAAARDGIQQVAAGTPTGAGALAVAQLRARVWGAAVGEDGLLAGSAYVADALGFLGEETTLPARTLGPWTRLTTARGHVLQRRAMPSLA